LHKNSIYGTIETNNNRN